MTVLDWFDIEKLDQQIYLISENKLWDYIGNTDKFEEVYLSKNANYFFKIGVEDPIESIREKVIRDVDKKLLPPYFNIDQFCLEISY